MLSISPCHDQELKPSAAYTQYSIHHVQHTLSTAYTAYCIIPRSTVSNSQPVTHLSADHVCTKLSTFSQLWVNEWIKSQLLSRRSPEVPPPEWSPPDWPPPDWPPPDWHPPSTPPISLDHGLQVYLQTRSITASKSVTKLAQLQPPSASPHSLDYSLQVHLPPRSITASKCISILGRPKPACVALN